MSQCALILLREVQQDEDPSTYSRKENPIERRLKAAICLQRIKIANQQVLRF